jgi:hypothetical protein
LLPYVALSFGSVSFQTTIAVFLTPYRVSKESHLDLKQNVLRKIHKFGLHFADGKELRPWLQRVFTKCEKMDKGSLRDFALVVLRQLAAERSVSAIQQSGSPTSQTGVECPAAAASQRDHALVALPPVCYAIPPSFCERSRAPNTSSIRSRICSPVIYTTSRIIRRRRDIARPWCTVANHLGSHSRRVLTSSSTPWPLLRTRADGRPCLLRPTPSRERYIR